MLLHFHSNLFPDIISVVKNFTVSKVLDMDLSSLLEISKVISLDCVFKYSTKSSVTYLTLLLCKSS